MKKTIIYCDVCGKQITGRVYKVGFGVVEGDQINGDEVFEDIEQDMDFCVNCIGDVAEMVRNCKDRMTASTLELEEQEEPKPVEEPKEKKTRKKVDAAKVWALYDANWGTADIAFEMMCSTQTVRNILARERPDMEVGNA